MPTVPKLEEVCEKAARLPCSPVLLPRLSKALASEGTTADELEAIGAYLRKKGLTVRVSP